MRAKNNAWEKPEILSSSTLIDLRLTYSVQNYTYCVWTNRCDSLTIIL